MHTGFLDVLHDAADDNVGSVSESIDIDFRGLLEELIDQHGTRRTHQCGLGDVLLHGVHVVSDDHGASAENVTRAHQNGHPDFAGDARCFFRNERGAVAGLRNFQFFEQPAKAAAVLGEIDGFGSCADDGHAIALQFQREIQRSLSTELNDDSLRLFAFDDRQNILERERFEIEAVGSVVVGRDRFRIAIHHDGFETIFAESEGRVAAAVIELNSLPDAIRAAAENHDFGARLSVGFVFILVGGIQDRA